MKNSVEAVFRPGQKPPVDAAGTALKVLEGEKEKGCSLTIVFVDSAEMKSINLNYRKKAKDTDVIAFEYGRKKGRVEGDVFICLSKARENAAQFGCGAEEEVRRLIIHGVLHVLGYDHIDKKEEKEMNARTKSYLKNKGGKK